MESFLHYLVPHAADIRSLSIAARRSPGPAPLSPLVWSTTTAALAVVGPVLTSLSLEWPEELVVSAWAVPLQRCASITLRAPRILIRPGFCSLRHLHDLRLRSTVHALAFVPGVHMQGGTLLPPGLRKLRLEGCHLSALPRELLGLSRLEDLVASDNIFGSSDLSGLSRLGSLRQLTLMGCRCASRRFFLPVAFSDPGHVPIPRLPLLCPTYLQAAPPSLCAVHAGQPSGAIP